MKKKNSHIWKIILGGSGGQGIVTLGRVLAYAGVSRKLNVSFLPTYGAEMRGGYVYSMISISSKELVSPVISSADYGVFMNETSMQMLLQYLKGNAWVLWNSSLVSPGKHLNNKNIGIPASEIAEKLGSVKVANMIMLGGLLKLLESTGFPVREKDIEFGIRETFKEDKGNLNIRAILEGKRIVAEVIQNGGLEI
ncbi:MAG: 2-oxoacid:acceptor oxidoreductase family protein [Candidatus Omnitrophica bacterium]|nr:2-oxoacid:acceptor oxidoreductase family protein [Candidatus Omnitrophota bacterium]MCM8817200.1 2-oxoacid:acceptor oxidoreductase family protein [Candidatus Omnitrophota bacterium]